jgi:hypothetical protein
MRKIPAALAALTLASLGVLVSATSAQADYYDDNWTCSDNYTAASYGYMYAYKNAFCNMYSMGYTSSWDSDWGNDSGPFQFTDTNNVSSVLNKGTLAVQFFNGTGQDWAGGYTCLSRNEAYASNLSDNYFTSGYKVNEAISSHRWVTESKCSRWVS